MNKTYDDILLMQYRDHPLMEIEDFIKMIYTGEFGGGHLIPDEAASLNGLMQEYASMPLEPKGEPLFEDIGGNICRLNLRALRSSGLKLRTVNRMFVYTAQTVKGSTDGVERKLNQLLALIKRGALPYDYGAAEIAVKNYQLSGYPVPRHSKTYYDSYAPSYRVVSSVFSRIFHMIERIDGLIEKNGKAVIAIDGNSGAGKSTIAALVANLYGANLFHMDDFFLPPERKTAERLEEPGGNVDYERFLHEIIRRLNESALYYRAFDCQRSSFSMPVRVPARPVTVIEGVYSQHPAFGDVYDLNVFLRAGGEKQMRRIMDRSGEALAKRFAQEWIPLENRYFAAHDIEAKCDLVYEL